MLQDSTADANQDDLVWVEAESETESNSTDASVEESLTDEEVQPEGTSATDVPKEQAQPSKEFSVADVDVKQLMRRGNTRKKE